MPDDQLIVDACEIRGRLSDLSNLYSQFWNLVRDKQRRIDELTQENQLLREQLTALNGERDE